MITFNIPPNCVPVFMNFEGDYTATDAQNNKEAAFRISIEDDEVIIRGDAFEIKEAASGLCHVFDAGINPDPTMPNDFVGMIQCAEGKKFPKGLIELRDGAYKGQSYRAVFLQVGERSMSFSTASRESACNMAEGLAQFLGLVKKRKGEAYIGSLKFA